MGGMVVDDIMSIENAAIRDFEVPESATETVRKRAKPTKIPKPAETTTESTKTSSAIEPVAEGSSVKLLLLIVSLFALPINIANKY